MVIATLAFFFFPFEQMRIKKVIIKNSTNIQTNKKKNGQTKLQDKW